MGVGFGAVGTSVGALFVGAGTVAVEVGVDVGAGVGVSGASVGTGEGAAGVCVGSDVASGPWESAGNGVVAAPGPGAGAAVGSKVTVDSGVSVRATSWVGVGSPQAKRAARVTRAARRNRIFTGGPFSLQVANSGPILYSGSARRPAAVVIRLPGPSFHMEVICLSQFTCQYFQPDLSCSRRRSNRTL